MLQMYQSSVPSNTEVFGMNFRYSDPECMLPFLFFFFFLILIFIEHKLSRNLDGLTLNGSLESLTMIWAHCLVHSLPEWLLVSAAHPPLGKVRKTMF